MENTEKYNYLENIRDINFVLGLESDIYCHVHVYKR